MMKTIGQRAFGVLLGAGVVAACSSGTEVVGFVANSNSTGATGATGGSDAPPPGGSTSSGGSDVVGAGGSTVAMTGGTGGSSSIAGTTGTTGGMGGAVSAGGSGGAPPAGGSGGAMNTGPINVLVFNYTAGYGHQSRETAIPLLLTAAAANNINLDLKYAIQKGKDGNYLPEGTSDAQAQMPLDLSAFTPGGLDKYDVVYFLNTTGHVFQGSDEATHQKALQDYMEQHHGGFVGTHSATDTYDENWQWYQDFVGSIYNGHSNGVIPGSARWKDGVTHSILTTAAVPNPWSRSEEWYLFRRDVSSLPGFTVLLVASESGGTERPSAWVHEISGGGRVFYTAFGHAVDTFKEPAFMTFLMTGIKWAAHRM
jgi:type 1 glutamine amidotransferase